MGFLRKFGYTLALDASPDAQGLVERPAPAAAPTAFRIWRAGENRADDGAVYFSPKSAKLLLEEQDSRGRVYSIDFDHLSLNDRAPPDARGAAGWHRLEVRRDADGQPELWAVGVEWCADAKAGLEADPPKWRFFSPAFHTTKEGEVVSYTNLALCINPLTHQLPALAARAAAQKGADPMDKKALLAALAALAGSEGSDEDKKKAHATLKAYLEDEVSDEKKKDAADGDDEEKKADGCEPEKKADGDGDDDKKDDDKKDDEEKKEAKAAAAGSGSDDASRKMAAELLEAKKDLEQIKIEKLLDGRKDLPASVRQWCTTQTFDNVKAFLDKMPRLSAVRPEAPTQGVDAGASAPKGLQGKELEELDKAMGIRTNAATAPHVNELGELVIPTVRPEAAIKWAKEAKWDPDSNTKRHAALRAGRVG